MFNTSIRSIADLNSCAKTINKKKKRQILAIMHTPNDTHTRRGIRLNYAQILHQNINNKRDESL